MRATHCAALSLFLAVVSFAPLAAHADITGDTLNASYFAPNMSINAQNNGNFTVVGGGNFLSVLNYHVTGTQVIFTFIENNGFTPQLFSGPVFTDLSESLAAYTVTLDPATNVAGYTSADASISGNVLSFNFAGHSLVATGTVIYDLTNSASPVPSHPA